MAAHRRMREVPRGFSERRLRPLVYRPFGIRQDNAGQGSRTGADRARNSQRSATGRCRRSSGSHTGGLRVRPLLSNLGAWGDRCFRSVLEVKQDTQAVVDILHRRSVNVFEELDSAELQSHSVRLIPISRYVRPISCRCGFLAPAMSPNLVRTHSDLTFISSS